MGAIDLLIIFLTDRHRSVRGVVRSQTKTTSDYFLGDRSVPGGPWQLRLWQRDFDHYVYLRSWNCFFARWQFSVFAALFRLHARAHRNLAAFHSSYFRGELMTVYQLLDRRFGERSRCSRHRFSW